MRPPSTERPLAAALLLSAALHLVAVLGPGWHLPHDGEAEPLQAVLRPAAPVSRSSPPLPVPPPRHQPVPPPAAAPAPLAETAGPAPAPAPPLPAVAAPAVPPPGVPATPAAPAAPVVVPVAATPPLSLPGQGRARYAVTRGDGGFVVGQALHSWEHDGQHYRLQSVTETTGLVALFRSARVTQASRGDIAGDGLRPREFRHERPNGADSASLDWERQRLSYAGRDEALPAGTQDLLSMFYQLALLAPQEGSLTLPIATGRKLENYVFTVLGPETLALAGASRRATRLRTQNGGDAIDIWLPADGGERRGLPLRIRISQRNGDVYEQTLDDSDLK